MGIISGGAVIEGAGQRVRTLIYGGAASAAAIKPAVTDTGTQQVFTGLWIPPFASRISATAGGTAGDIKAIQVTIGGTDPAGNAITEALPAFDVNTAATKTGLKVFASVNSITIPAHDGTGATTAVGVGGAPAVADADGIMTAHTDDGAPEVITTGIVQPDVPRNITATAGGTAGDIKAITVTIAGTNADGVAITEVLPAFTENNAGIVSGAKAFRTVTSITIPAHDDTGATTAIGYGDVVGIGLRLARKSVMNAYLAETVETTAPATVVSASALEGNTFDLNSALNSTQVKLEVIPTP